MARKKGRNLSHDEKMHIVFKSREGYSMRKISSSLKVSRNSDADVLKKWRETYRESEKRSREAEKIERFLVRKSLTNRRLTSSQLAGCMINNVSARTVRQILLKYGLRGCIAAKKPLLSSKNRKARFEWAKRFCKWTVQRWRKALFSDESCFELFPSKH